MAEVKEKHPSWFKMKLERRQMIRKLPPENAVNVLLACWDYLETEKLPENLSPFESIAASAFLPDLEEAWARYEQRVNARASNKNTGRKKRVVSNDIERYHSISCEREEETEPEPEPDPDPDPDPDPHKGDGSNTVGCTYIGGAASKGGPSPVQLFDPEKPETWGDAE